MNITGKLQLANISTKPDTLPTERLVGSHPSACARQLHTVVEFDNSIRPTTPTYGCRVRQLHTPDNSNVRLSSSTTLYARQLQRTVVEFDNSMRLKPCACCISDACCKAISSACVLPAQGCRYPEYPEQGLLYPVQLVLPC
jgi:hypothetical protein